MTILVELAKRVLSGELSLEVATERIDPLDGGATLEWADVTAAQQMALEWQQSGHFGEADVIVSLTLVAGHRLVRNDSGGPVHRLGGALMRMSGDANGVMGYSYLLKAISALASDHLDDADVNLEEAANRYVRDARMRAEVAHYKVDLLLRRGSHIRAATLARQTVAQLDSLGAPAEAFETGILLGRALAVMGDLNGAIAALERSRRGLVELGQPERAERAVDLLHQLRRAPGSVG